VPLAPTVHHVVYPASRLQPSGLDHLLLQPTMSIETASCTTGTINPRRSPLVITPDLTRPHRWWPPGSTLTIKSFPSRVWAPPPQLPLIHFLPVIRVPSLRLPWRRRQRSGSRFSSRWTSSSPARPATRLSPRCSAPRPSRRRAAPARRRDRLRSPSASSATRLAASSPPPATSKVRSDPHLYRIRFFRLFACTFT
jgi:hypothetical protein